VVEISDRLVDQQTGHLDAGGHVGQLVLCNLVLGDASADLNSLPALDPGEIRHYWMGTQYG
jgi:hypothetical protein